jgi:hypothetical protein
VGEYCRQMKGLADSLRNLGEPVADRTLVLNLLCGLSPCYDHLKALIKRTVPFPTFHVVRNELLLEELTMTHDAPTLAVVLYSTIPSAQVSPGGQPPPPPRARSVDQDPRSPPPLLLLLRTLINIPPPMAVVAPTRADVGATAPLMEVPPATRAVRVGHRSTTPRPAPSPCGRVRPLAPPVLPRRR